MGAVSIRLRVVNAPSSSCFSASMTSWRKVEPRCTAAIFARRSTSSGRSSVVRINMPYCIHAASLPGLGRDVKDIAANAAAKVRWPGASFDLTLTPWLEGWEIQSHFLVIVRGGFERSRGSHGRPACRVSPVTGTFAGEMRSLRLLAAQSSAQIGRAGSHAAFSWFCGHGWASPRRFSSRRWGRTRLPDQVLALVFLSRA